MMEVFAGYAAHVDHHMGRIIDAVKQMPNADNTIFIYIVGDNGASRRRGTGREPQREPVLQRLPREVGRQPRAHRRDRRAEVVQPLPQRLGARDEHAVPVDQAGRQPLRRHPQPDDHFLAGEDQGQGRRSGRSSCTSSTSCRRCTKRSASRRRTMLNGIEQKPIEGVSFLKTFTDKNAPETRKTQYFELLVNRGMYHDGWMASSRSFVPLGADPRRVRPADREVGTLRHRQGLLAGEQPRRPAPGEGQGTRSALLEGSREVPGPAARLARPSSG